jgi:hypothetical protein
MSTNGTKTDRFTFGCEGCQNRKDILTAGNWQVDAAIVGTVIVLAAIYIVTKQMDK